MNEEFPVSASHQLALITSLPFVHTARRYYRLDGLVRPSDWSASGGSARLGVAGKKVKLDHSRGSKSRNKVSVGEPAEGSLRANRTYRCFRVSLLSLVESGTLYLCAYLSQRSVAHGLWQCAGANILCQRLRIRLQAWSECALWPEATRRASRPRT